MDVRGQSGIRGPDCNPRGRRPRGPIEVTVIPEPNYHTYEFSIRVSEELLTVADATRILSESFTRALAQVVQELNRFNSTFGMGEFSESAIDTAERRAEELLLENLNPDQRRDYDLTRSFKVRSQSGHLFRLTSDRNQNVGLLDGNYQVVRRFCVVPGIPDVPIADQLLMQKLMLEYDEERFRDTAMPSPYYRVTDAGIRHSVAYLNSLGN